MNEDLINQIYAALGKIGLITKRLDQYANASNILGNIAFGVKLTDASKELVDSTDIINKAIIKSTTNGYENSIDMLNNKVLKLFRTGKQ